MNITVAEIKEILEKDYGWENMNVENYQSFLIEELIEDVAKIVTKIVEDEFIRKNSSFAPEVQPHSEYQDIEADGIVFCGKCGKQK